MNTHARRRGNAPYPADLTCNDLVCPLGVDEDIFLSWHLAVTTGRQCQTAYRVLAGTDPDFGADGETADRWDSGRVESDGCVHILYGGPAPAPRQRIYWKVMLWDRADAPTAWSDTAWFETGLKGDVRGQWIGAASSGREDCLPAPLLRTKVHLPERPVKARAYLCGVGYHALYVNDAALDAEVLTPGVTAYDKRVLYQSVDITEHLYRGDNVLGVVLGNGFYNALTQDAWDFRHAPWRAQPRLWLQAHFWLEDGREIVETTGPHWRAADGPIVFNALRNGETYDARLEKPGWSAPDYNDRDFLPVRVAPAPGGRLVSQQMTPIRVTDTIQAQECTQTDTGSWVYDFGKNLSGSVAFEAPGKPDACVTFRYGEVLDGMGHLDTAAISRHITGGDFQTDRYTMKGDALEHYEPRFTYHGFRYVEVTGYPGALTPRSVKARQIHTDLGSRGRFDCSDATASAIQAAILQTTLTNYHGIPTDCPHREKNGWTGDAALSAEQVLMNFDPSTAYRKWMDDIADAQRPSGQLPGIVPTGGWGFNWGSGPAWDAALVLIPWYQYLYRGDMLILRRSWPAIRRYMDFLLSMEGADGLYEFGLGDWCPPAKARHNECPTVITDTACASVLAATAGRIAGALGLEDDAAALAAEAARIRAAFRHAFMTADGITGQSQTALACALYQGMTEPEEEKAYVNALIQEIHRCGDRMDCGILGSKYLLHTLADHDEIELGYKLITRPDYPSLGNWIARGATTLWETWEGDASRNHPMYSDAGMFFYRGLAGIRLDPQAPGFRHFTLRPALAKGLIWVNGTHESPYGPIVSNWRIEQHTLKYHCNVPPGCAADLTLPFTQPEALLLCNAPAACRRDGERISYALPAGRYRFECRLG